MSLRQLLRRFVPVIVALGIALGPFSAMAAAPTTASEAMAAMADDMPCRPLDQTTTPDSQSSCPLMVMCAASWISGAPVLAVSVFAFGPSPDTISPRSDVLRSALGEQPPARPPRT